MDIIAFSWIAWIAIALICLIIEMLTLEFTFLMIGLGCIAGLVASLTGIPFWAQVLIAAATAFLLLFLVRPSLLARMNRSVSNEKSNVDALIGMGGEVTTMFQRGAGQVTLVNGETWSSRISPTVPPRDPDVGERVVVTAIEGATAVVVPAQR